MINGISRLALQILEGKNQIIEVLVEIRDAIRTLVSVEYVRIFHRIRLYADRHEISTPKAFVQIFFLGLNQVEPATASNNRIQVEKQIQSELFDEEFEESQNQTEDISQGSNVTKRFSWALGGYILASSIGVLAGGIALWKYPPGSQERQVLLMGLLLLFLPSISVVQTLLKDMAAIKESRLAWKPNQWFYALSICTLPFIMVLISIFTVESNEAAVYILFGVPTTFTAVCGTYLYQRHQYVKMN